MFHCSCFFHHIHWFLSFSVWGQIIRRYEVTYDSCSFHKLFKLPITIQYSLLRKNLWKWMWVLPWCHGGSRLSILYSICFKWQFHVCRGSFCGRILQSWQSHLPASSTTALSPFPAIQSKNSPYIPPQQPPQSSSISTIFKDILPWHFYILTAPLQIVPFPFICSQ